MIKVVDNQQIIREFAALGVRFSKLYPNGIPHFLSSEMNYFDPEKNFMLRKGGTLKAFLYEENGSYQGRIGAMTDPDMPGTGLVGLFDCVNDYPVAKALLDEACSYLYSIGCKRIVGPMNFSIYQTYRFMTKGFEEQSYLSEPRNPEYYPVFFESYGFKELFHWVSKAMNRAEMKVFLEENRENAETHAAVGYTLQQFTPDKKEELMRETYRILLVSYKDFPMFTPMTEEDFMREFSMLPDLIDADCSGFGYNPRGEFISFLTITKDYAAAVRSMNGKTNLLAKLKFLLNRNKMTFATIIQGGTTPTHIREAFVLARRQTGKNLGLADASIYNSIENILKKNRYQYLMFSLVRDNSFMRNHINRFEAPMREYCLYELVPTTQTVQHV
jgi:hypothetical protein